MAFIVRGKLLVIIYKFLVILAQVCSLVGYIQHPTNWTTNSNAIQLINS